MIWLVLTGSLTAWLLASRWLFRRWVRADCFWKNAAACSHGYTLIDKGLPCHPRVPRSHLEIAALAIGVALFLPVVLPVVLFTAAVMAKPPLSTRELNERIKKLEEENDQLRRNLPVSACSSGILAPRRGAGRSGLPGRPAAVRRYPPADDLPGPADAAVRFHLVAVNLAASQRRADRAGIARRAVGRPVQVYPPFLRLVLRVRLAPVVSLPGTPASAHAADPGVVIDHAPREGLPSVSCGLAPGSGPAAPGGPREPVARGTVHDSRY